MINLMPYEAKTELKAARSNVLILRYMGVLFFGALFLAFILGGSYYLLGQNQAISQQLISLNDTKADVFSSTKQQVQALSNQLTEARVLLDQEILYSNVLVNFAQQMPPGTVIDGMKLDSGSFTGTPLSLTVYAKTTDDAVALRDRFQASPFFKDVKFQTISDSTNDGITGYPVTATLTLTFDRSIAK